MNLINIFKKGIQNHPRTTIGFVEGHSKRMIEAAHYLKDNNLLNPIMFFETTKTYNEVKDKLKDLKVIIIDQEKDLYFELANLYAEKRAGKETKEQSFNNLKKAEFFVAMMMEANKIDGGIGGVHLPTASILRAAFKSITPYKEVKTISSIMIMSRGSENFIFSDISVNPKPNKKQLIDIAKNATLFTTTVNEVLKDVVSDVFANKVAFLSFSTSGSGKNPSSQLMAEVTKEFNELNLTKHKAIGEVQFDTAYLEGVRKQKYHDKSAFDGKADIYIFPDLNSGNIGYKIAQRLGDFSAMGPIIVGLSKPMNDLSRGSTVQNVIDSAIVTAVEATIVSLHSPKNKKENK